MYIYIFLIIDFFNSRFEFVRYPRLAREGAYRTNSREIRAMQLDNKEVRYCDDKGRHRLTRTQERQLYFQCFATIT